MPIRVFRQVTFLVSLILAAFLVAGFLAFFVTYKESGIFDAGFRQKHELSEMKLVGDEVLEGLPSLTVEITPTPGTAGESKPQIVLEEVGKNISNASKRDDAFSEIVNVDYATKVASEVPVKVRFRFNASTAVDYNDEVYNRTLNLLIGLIDSEKYSSVSVESTPTPDGGRSLNVETVMKNTSDDNSPLEMSNAWTYMMQPITRFVGDEGNLSSAKMYSKDVSISAEFFDSETYDQAVAVPHNAFELLDVVSNSVNPALLKEGNLNLLPVNAEDSTLTVLLKKETEEATFNKVSNSLQDSIRRHSFSSMPWTVLVTVEGAPELSSVMFGLSG